MDLSNEIQKQVEFTLDLYKRLSEQHPSTNVAVSPISISITMAMVAAGARGPTLDQFSSSLKLPPGDLLHNFASQVKTSILADASGKGGPSVAVANSIWIETTLPLKPSFLQILREKHHSDARKVDFLHKAEEARQDVNSWAEEHTQGKIKDLQPPGAVESSTRLVLANAIYFKGTWNQPFAASETKDGTFHLLDGNTISVQMMASRNKQHFLGQFVEDGYQALRIPYAQGGDTRAFSMYFLLPYDIAGLPDLEKKLDSSSLIQNLGNLRQGPVAELKLPRFRISSQSEVPSVLQAMGLVLPFSDEADFSDLVVATPVSLSKVFHKTFVEVNEEGTEAAAATAAVMMCRSLPRAPTASFVADHPFLFVIKEDQTNLVLFVGKVTDPSRSA